MAHHPRCLVKDLGNAAAGDEITLDRAAAHHLGRVLRRRAGDPVEVVDGAGGCAHATWHGEGRLQLTEVLPREPEPSGCVTLALPPPRLPRLEWLVEKATELDVDRLLLLQTDHSQRDLSPNRLERLRRKAESALLQCGRRHGLQLSGPVAFDEVLASVVAESPAPTTEIWLARPGGAAPPPPAPLRDGAPAPALLILIGPEGGFHAEEEAAATRAGARPVTLGRTTLRMETAALALAAWATARRGP